MENASERCKELLREVTRLCSVIESSNSETATWAALNRSSRPSPGQQVGPSPGQQVGPSPGQQVGPSPAQQVGPSPAQQVGPSPAQQVGPSPAQQVGPSPAQQVGPSPAQQVGPSPVQLSCSRNPWQEHRRLFGFQTLSASRKRKAGKAKPEQEKKKKKEPTLTRKFVCLADKDAIKIPTPGEYAKLKKASLGEKKITLLLADTCHNVDMKLKKEFPKLEFAGGYALSCSNTTRQLERISPPYSATRLKESTGQGKIFIVPLQRNLDITPDTPFEEEAEDDLLESCFKCNGVFYLHELSSHLESCRDLCTLEVESSDSENEQFTTRFIAVANATSSATSTVASLSATETAVTPSATGTAVTPSSTGTTVTPSATETADTPSATGVTTSARGTVVCPSATGTTVTPSVTDVTPSATAVAPSSTGTVVSPSATGTTVTSLSTGTTVTPSVTAVTPSATAVTPSSTGTVVSPSATGTTVTSSSTGTVVSPSATGTTVTSLSTGTTFTPSVTAVTPSSTGTAFTPSSTGSAVTPSSTGTTVTPSAAIFNVIPSARNDTAVLVEESEDDNEFLEPTFRREDQSSNVTQAVNARTSTGDDENVDQLAQKVVNYCIEKDIHNPTEILRCIQKFIVRGRALEVQSAQEVQEGETNFIIVDRQNILETAFDEIQTLTDLRKTLEVQFYNEEAQDYGGPRKEFFRLCLTKIKETYFDKGLRELMRDKYTTVGVILGLSIIQNGALPRFLSLKILEDVFLNENPGPCLKELQDGLKKTGIYQVGNQMPIFLHMLKPGPPSILTVRRLISLLEPMFSESGSNRRTQENAVYSQFIKYVREAASGRRNGVTLEHILRFITGADEEPVLGFVIQPSITFVEAVNSFLPTANTCISCLRLPRPSLHLPLPPTAKLFDIFDLAFSNTYFGNV